MSCTRFGNTSPIGSRATWPLLIHPPRPSITHPPTPTQLVSPQPAHPTPFISFRRNTDVEFEFPGGDVNFLDDLNSNKRSRCVTSWIVNGRGGDAPWVELTVGRASGLGRAHRPADSARSWPRPMLTFLFVPMLTPVLTLVTSSTHPRIHSHSPAHFGFRMDSTSFDVGPGLESLGSFGQWCVRDHRHNAPSYTTEH